MYENVSSAKNNLPRELATAQGDSLLLLQKSDLSYSRVCLAHQKRPSSSDAITTS